jgi:hypothetical protein
MFTKRLMNFGLEYLSFFVLLGLEIWDFMDVKKFPFQTVKISLFQTVKISFSKLSKFPFPNCQNFLFQTVKIFLSKLSKTPALFKTKTMKFLRCATPKLTTGTYYDGNHDFPIYFAFPDSTLK